MALIDEISFDYWKNNRKKVSGRKEFNCIHNNYTYGDGMPQHCVIYNHATGSVCDGKGTKQAYFNFVGTVCCNSTIAFNNYRHMKAEKYRLFSEEEVNAFTEEKHRSTRIDEKSQPIIIDGNKYYIATNLKICEYLEAASKALSSSEARDWFIQLHDGINVSPKSPTSHVLPISKPSDTSAEERLEIENYEKSAAANNIPIEKVTEGKHKRRMHFAIDRDTRIIAAAKAEFKNKHHNRLYCEICGFDFVTNYGPAGDWDGAINGHHKVPLSAIDTDMTETSINDIAIVCRNCHAMLHRPGFKHDNYMTVEEVKQLWSENH